MGSTDYGTQTITPDFKQPAQTQSFNKINYQLFKTGIYEGGLLTRVDDANITVAPLTCYITDPSTELGVRVETTVNATIAISSSTPFVILRFTWVNFENNYMDMLSVAAASIQEGDLIVGKGIYSGATLTTPFDYSRRDDVKSNQTIPYDLDLLPDTTGIIIPMYIYPFDGGQPDSIKVEYQQLIDLALTYHEVPVYCVLNPDNGAGSVYDGVYYDIIKRLHAANIKVLGYIATGYIDGGTSTPVSAEVLDTGDGSTTVFSGTLSAPSGFNYVTESSISVDYTISGTPYTATDDGAGNITGTGISTGTINYSTYAWAITFSTAPDNAIDITMDYDYTTTEPKTLQESKDAIDNWLNFYSEIDGIFYDENSNIDDLDEILHYQQLNEYAHNLGLFPNIGNPGAAMPESWFSSVPAAADVFVTREATSFDTEANLRDGIVGANHDKHNRKQRANLIYDQSSFDFANFRLSAKYLGMLYATDDGSGGANPWDSLSTYIEEQFITLNNVFNDSITIYDPTGSGTSILNLGDNSDDNIGNIIYNHSDNSLSTTVNTSLVEHYNSSGQLSIGTSTKFTNAKVSILQTTAGSYDFGIVCGSSISDTTTKIFNIGVNHYTIAQEPLTIINATSTTSTGVINIGGGSGLGNAATEINFYTAANNTTTTGTIGLTIDSSGNSIVKDGYLEIYDSTGSGTSSIYFGDNSDDDTGKIIYDHSDNSLNFYTDTSAYFRIDTSGKLSTNNETSPDVSKGGLCLNQGAEDSNILTFKSSDIDHGITDFAETDTFAEFVKTNATDGGLAIIGYGEDDRGLSLITYAVNENTTIGAGGIGTINLQSGKKSGTGSSLFSSTANILSVRNYTAVRLLLNGDGDLWIDGGYNAVYRDTTPTNSTVFLETKIIEIGDWNMDTTGALAVTHGISDHTKIRSVNVIIRDDAATSLMPLNRSNTPGADPDPQGSVEGITSTQFSLYRKATGVFDSNLFDSTSYNRGWIYVTYEV